MRVVGWANVVVVERRVRMGIRGLNILVGGLVVVMLVDLRYVEVRIKAYWLMIL